MGLPVVGFCISTGLICRAVTSLDVSLWFNLECIVASSYYPRLSLKPELIETTERLMAALSL